MAVTRVFLVVGCPGSGKSWVCEQLGSQFEYVRHDDFKDPAKYVSEIVKQARTANKALLIETPFSVSQIKEPLEKRGFDVTPVYIQEEPETLKKRYRDRENKDIPAGHLTRQETYKQRAHESGSFQGTSNQVLSYLKSAAPAPKMPWE